MSTATLTDVANHPKRTGREIHTGRPNPKPADVVKLRESAGMTQTEFGELAYKSLRVVQDWEGGQRNCPPDTFELISIKIRARDLVKRGRLAPQAMKDLGLELPE